MQREQENEEMIIQKPAFEIIKNLWDIFLFALQLSIGLYCKYLGIISTYVIIAISIHYLSNYSNLVDVNAFGFCFILFFMLIVPCCFGFNQSLNLHVAKTPSNQGLGLSYLMLNLYFQSMYIIIMTLIIYLLKYPLSLILKEDREETINQSWNLLPYMAMFVMAMVNFNNIRAYLFGRQCIHLFKYIHLASILLHILFCEICIPNSQNKIIGAGFALIYTQVSILILVLVLILLTDLKDKFSGFTKCLAFNYQLFKSYFKGTIGLVFQLYLDLLFLHILNLVASQLSLQQFGAQIILVNFLILYIKLPFCVTLSIQIYVGAAIAKGNSRDAKTFSIIGAILIIIIVLILSTLCWIFSDQIIHFYTNDEEVQLYCKSVFNFIIFLCLPFDSITLIQVGILRGLDQNKYIFLVTSISYYPVGLTLIYVLTFVVKFNPQLRGVWFGYLFIDIIFFILFMIALCAINWEEQSFKMQKKIKKQQDLWDSIEETQQLKD